MAMVIAAAKDVSENCRRIGAKIIAEFSRIKNVILGPRESYN
jgi:hypothetical protein